jgi:hypothetical protein
MAIKVLLAAGAAVVLNGLAVTLTEDTEVSIDAAVTVDQAAEMCGLANLNVNLTHVDESAEQPVLVTYAPADASRQETPVNDDTPAPAGAPTADALVSGDVTAPPAPVATEVEAVAEPATVPADVVPTPAAVEETAPVIEEAVAESPATEVVESEPILEPIIETPGQEPNDAPVETATVETPEQVFESEVSAAEKEFEAKIEGDKPTA